MKFALVTFEAIEKATGVGSVRGIDVDHTRRIIRVTYDETFGETINRRHEGATIENGNFPVITAEDVQARE